MFSAGSRMGILKKRLTAWTQEKSEPKWELEELHSSEQKRATAIQTSFPRVGRCFPDC